ncbi:hypothetical protein GS399_09955 [Pedobacter sp. HMF7647]|uniref:Uncharacterized protein n=2 Tax=Hufsiella arboris TaxID=2695275 RepID=A0A7K1YA92_9SPHI|nr:hypothetical protein [Hufsiella arboris]
MKRAIQPIRQKYPDVPYTFSMDHYKEKLLADTSIPFLDFIEQHIWMSSMNDGEFNNKLGLDWNGFSADDYHRLVQKAEPLYKENKTHWDAVLTNSIKQLAADAKAASKPLISTECWSLVNYKDYPMLEWNWIKDLCELGVTTAAATGQWVAMATSNFCGPQFEGMWQDVEWHQKMTAIIKNAPIMPSVENTKIVKRFTL